MLCIMMFHRPFWKYIFFVPSTLMVLALGLVLRFSVWTGHHGACSLTFAYCIKIFQRLIRTTYSLYSFTRNLPFSKENHPPATFCASPGITVLNTPNRKTQEDIFIGKFRMDSCHSNEVNTLSKQDVN